MFFFSVHVVRFCYSFVCVCFFPFLIFLWLDDLVCAYIYINKNTIKERSNVCACMCVFVHFHIPHIAYIGSLTRPVAPTFWWRLQVHLYSFLDDFIFFSYFFVCAFFFVLFHMRFGSFCCYNFLYIMCLFRLLHLLLMLRLQLLLSFDVCSCSASRSLSRSLFRS